MSDERVRELEAANDELLSACADYKTATEAMIEERRALVAEVKERTEALEFYASRDHYDRPNLDWCSMHARNDGCWSRGVRGREMVYLNDDGARARAALTQEEKP